MNTNGSTYYNDNNSFCCEVLRKNINAGHLPEGYVDERDIREVHATDFMGYNHVHLFAGIGVFPLGLSRASFPTNKRVLTGGFPCQDISDAGKRAGIEGERSGLWLQMDRLIQEAIDLHLAFDYILVENVAALVNRGLPRVLTDLTKAGYDTEWTTLRASDFGAPHQRERIFIVAYSHSNRQWRGKVQQERQPWSNESSDLSDDGTQGTMAHPDFQGLEVGNRCQSKRRTFATSQQYSERQFEPRICGNAYGAAAWMDRYQWPARPGQEQYDYEPSRIITEKQQNRVARLKALGNAIVVPCVEYIGRCLVAREMDSVA